MSTRIAATELAPKDTWIKSSYSDGTGNNCVEVAKPTATRTAVGIRDSKNRTGPVLVVPASAWVSFVGVVRSGGGAT